MTLLNDQALRRKLVETCVARYFSILTVAATLTACGPQIHVYSDHDPDYDVLAYTTYAWGTRPDLETGSNPLYYNELMDKRIKQAVQEQLNARGYTLESGTPDLILHYHIVVDDQSIVTTTPYGYAYGQYWMRVQTNVYPYREGTLILDLMDRKTNNLIWRGWAVSVVDEIDPEKVDDLVKVAVKKIFSKFPKGSRGKSTAKEVVAH